METIPALKARLVPELYKIAAAMPMGALASMPRTQVGRTAPIKPPAPQQLVPKPAAPGGAAAPAPAQSAAPMPMKTAAFRMGYAQACREKIDRLCPDAVFEKVASQTRIPKEVLKLAYLRKVAEPSVPAAAAAAPAAAGRTGLFGAARRGLGRAARSPLGLLLGAGGLAMFGIPAAKGLSNMVQRGTSGYGWGFGSNPPGTGLFGAPHMGTVGGFDPKATSELQKMIAMEGMRNQQFSSLLQGIRGAYMPAAASPWGNVSPAMQAGPHY